MQVSIEAYMSVPVEFFFLSFVFFSISVEALQHKKALHPSPFSFDEISTKWLCRAEVRGCMSAEPMT